MKKCVNFLDALSSKFCLQGHSCRTENLYVDIVVTGNNVDSETIAANDGGELIEPVYCSLKFCLLASIGNVASY